MAEKSRLTKGTPVLSELDSALPAWETELMELLFHPDRELGSAPQLWQALKHKQRDALDRLFQYGQSLFHEKARRLLHRRNDSLRKRLSPSDLVDNAYLWLVNCYWHLEPKQTLRHLIGAAVRHALAETTGEKMDVAPKEEKLPPRLTDTHAGSPGELLQSNEARELMLDAIDHLPTPDRDIIRQRFFENQSLHTIAEKLQISPSSVGRHLHQAMEALRGQLQK
ncbi:MAG TPA: sigma-70 family RNA polymerase sigma factor [Gemmataceae bacterium]|nr:sigma-70 family RNA polymerase sigma factor [Gemmataceae bacterium]